MSMRTNGRPITRADLEQAFQRVVGEGEKTVTSAAPAALVVAAAGVLVAVTLAYLAGRRRGRRRSSVVEIRRL